MRNVTVRPTAGEGNAETGDKDKDNVTDTSDGYDPLSPDSLGPLLSSNQYSMRKIAAQALMDVALMMANISQLRTLLTAGDAMEYYVALITLVAFSLAFQLLFAILIFLIWMRENDQHQKDDYLKTLREVLQATKGGTAEDDAKIRSSYLQRVEDYKENRVTSHLNYVTMVLVFVITVINMFITGFGIKLETS
uniref:Uncharacterized protein n=1 Tax=Arion vulgaris TaxID=1028688 RepID=A0A0B6Y9L8_9EUPU